MLEVSETSSQGAVGFELRGTDYFLPRLYDLNKHCGCEKSKTYYNDYGPNGLKLLYTNEDGKLLFEINVKYTK